MKSIAIDLHYLPNLEFFAAIEGVEEVLIFPQALYQRQSFLNRTQIRLANKVETLSVPVQGRRPKIPMEEVLIDYSQKWQAIHLRGIQSAYGKAPFFEYFYPYFETVFTQKPASLWELNREMLTICLRLLQSPAKLVNSSLDIDLAGSLDIRQEITPKTDFSARSHYEPVPYSQLFGLDFEPNLSVIDLLFCEGPAAKKIIAKSVRNQ
jgi:hypothetical protein